MEPEYTSQQEISQEKQQAQIQEAKDEERWTVDQSDGSMYFFLTEQTGWRMVVTDAAAGSRFYELEKRKTAGRAGRISMQIHLEARLE